MSTLSNPSVEVNNDAIAIIPNSLSFKKGKGEKKALPQSAGGNSIEIVQTEDAETKKSMVKFSLRNTKSNQDLLDTWQDTINTIRLSQGDFVVSFRGMIVTNDPEIQTGADGNLELNFEGTPAV